MRVLSKAQLAGIQSPDPNVQTGLRIITLSLDLALSQPLPLSLTLTIPVPNRSPNPVPDPDPNPDSHLLVSFSAWAELV